MKLTLKAARINCGMSQAEVAKKIGCTTTTLSYWENGKVDITAINLKRLCDLYGISLNDVVLTFPSDTL